MPGTLASEFAAAIDRLGPFEPSPALAVAVSGGADSMALAVLAQDWVDQRGGSAIGLVVDHALRPASAPEAAMTIERLERLGIRASLLRLEDLRHGPRLAERARARRYQALAEACQRAQVLHLLVGHHARDQIETLAMRVLRGSRTQGLACMSAVRETTGLRLLRPLLGIEPARLRRFLSASGIGWVEDPSNQDTNATRPRLRQRLRASTAGDNGLLPAIAAVAQERVRQETETARELAARATIRPEGFAILSPGRIGAAALSRLIRIIGGRPYPTDPDRISDLAERPRPATIAGVRLAHAGRSGDGLLIVREEAAAMQPVELLPRTIWDNRFRVAGSPAAGATIGKLGADAARFRDRCDLPSSVLRTLPAVRRGNLLAAVPHLGYAATGYHERIGVMFSPPEPASGACFVPTVQTLGH